MSADQWEFTRNSFEPGRTLGAFDGARMVGTALAWSSDLVVPGGAVLPMAAVTRVGVRADHRRRGVLRSLMRAQLDDMAARGDVLAGLHASEPGIYGRFGYGIGTLAHRVAARRALLRAEVPATGSVRIVEAGEVSLPELYAKARGGRVGSMARPRAWWATFYERSQGVGENVVVAVHTGPDGDDGFVAWRPSEADDPSAGVTLAVEDLVASTPSAAFALWRFLLGMDLVECVRSWLRPVDDPLAVAVVDPRAITVEALTEDLWVRVVDVPTALARRSYQDGDPVVIEVDDPFLPANSGHYRIGPDSAARCDGPAAVSLPVDVLSMLYLGSWSWSALAEAGRVRVRDPAAPPRLDRLFAVDRAAFNGTFF